VTCGREAIVSGPRHLAERPRGTSAESDPVRAELDRGTESQWLRFKKIATPSIGPSSWSLPKRSFVLHPS
jgi:hypothetical protein